MRPGKKHFNHVSHRSRLAVKNNGTRKKRLNAYVDCVTSKDRAATLYNTQRRLLCKARNVRVYVVLPCSALGVGKFLPSSGGVSPPRPWLKRQYSTDKSLVRVAGPFGTFGVSSNGRSEARRSGGVCTNRSGKLRYESIFSSFRKERVGSTSCSTDCSGASRESKSHRVVSRTAEQASGIYDSIVCGTKWKKMSTKSGHGKRGESFFNSAKTRGSPRVSENSIRTVDSVAGDAARGATDQMKHSAPRAALELPLRHCAQSSLGAMKNTGRKGFSNFSSGSKSKERFVSAECSQQSSDKLFLASWSSLNRRTEQQERRSLYGSKDCGDTMESMETVESMENVALKSSSDFELFVHGSRVQPQQSSSEPYVCCSAGIVESYDRIVPSSGLPGWATETQKSSPHVLHLNLPQPLIHGQLDMPESARSTAADVYDLSFLYHGASDTHRSTFTGCTSSTRNTAQKDTTPESTARSPCNQSSAHYWNRRLQCTTFMDPEGALPIVSPTESKQRSCDRWLDCGQTKSTITIKYFFHYSSP